MSNKSPVAVALKRTQLPSSGLKSMILICSSRTTKTQFAKLANAIMRGSRNKQLKMSGFAIARALDTKHALRGARGVLASGGLHDAHEVVLKPVELCTEQFDSSGRESRGGLSTMAKGQERCLKRSEASSWRWRWLDRLEGWPGPRGRSGRQECVPGQRGSG